MSNQFKLKVSPPFVAQAARDSFKQKSSFTLVTLDVEKDGPQHHAAVLVWGDGADVASHRARTIMQAVNAVPELLEALKYAAELIPTARGYFPKSIKNSDRFRLENTCATISKALALVDQQEVQK